MFQIPARFEHRPFGPALPSALSVLGLAGRLEIKVPGLCAHYSQTPEKEKPAEAGQILEQQMVRSDGLLNAV